MSHSFFKKKREKDSVSTRFLMQQQPQKILQWLYIGHQLYRNKGAQPSQKKKKHLKVPLMAIW